MERVVLLTYRTRLLHLEPDGSPVLDDDGNIVHEDVTVQLAVNTRVLQRQSPRSVALIRSAADKAVRVANAGMATPRPMVVTNLAFVSHHAPAPRR
jgi:hypothetical protein